MCRSFSIIISHSLWSMAGCGACRIERLLEDVTPLCNSWKVTTGKDRYGCGAELIFRKKHVPFLSIFYSFFFFFFKDIYLKLGLLPPYSGSSEHFIVTQFDVIMLTLCTSDSFLWHFIGTPFSSLFVSMETDEHFSPLVSNSPAWLICSWCSVLRGYRLTKSFLQCIKYPRHKWLILFQLCGLLADNQCGNDILFLRRIGHVKHP